MSNITCTDCGSSGWGEDDVLAGPQGPLCGDCADECHDCHRVTLVDGKDLRVVTADSLLEGVLSVCTSCAVLRAAKLAGIVLTPEQLEVAVTLWRDDPEMVTDRLLELAQLTAPATPKRGRGQPKGAAPTGPKARRIQELAAELAELDAKRAKFAAERDQLIRELHAEGHGTRPLARLAGVTPGTLDAILKPRKR